MIFLCSPLSSPNAFANCPVPEIRANGEFFKADLVLSGRVLSEQYTKIGDDFGWNYRLKIIHSFKGSTVKKITVYTADDSNRFPLEKERDYLLFVYRSHHHLEINSCGNSAKLPEALKSIAEIQRIAASRYGEIEGWLAPETEGVDVSGIHVKIRRGPHVYRAMTDNDGYFHFRAPAGQYAVDFGNHEYYVNGGDTFWYGPSHFTLHRGEAAALQFVSVRHPSRNAPLPCSETSVASISR